MKCNTFTNGNRSSNNLPRRYLKSLIALLVNNPVGLIDSKIIDVRSLVWCRGMSSSPKAGLVFFLLALVLIGEEGEVGASKEAVGAVVVGMKLETSRLRCFLLKAT